MKRAVLIVAAGLAAMLLARAVLAAEEEGFTPLFDGKNLDQWKVSDAGAKHWTIADGVLKYDGKDRDLWTKQSFGDFVLKVDWRLPAPGDSGIYVRGTSKAQANIWTSPMGSGEVWGYRTDQNLPEEIRKAATPAKKADKPVGEWNTFVITVKGDRMTVVLNGEEVISNLEIRGAPKSGAIALQNHGNPVEFRNIFIKELKP